MRLSRKQRIPVTPFGFLIYKQVWGLGSTQIGASPGHGDLHRLISVPYKIKKKLASGPHLRVLEPIF